MFLVPVTRAILVPDVYRGFDIPAGTVIAANIWLVYHVNRIFPTFLMPCYVAIQGCHAKRKLVP